MLSASSKSFSRLSRSSNTILTPLLLPLTTSTTTNNIRTFSSASPPRFTHDYGVKTSLPPMVYISGEEMTHYASTLVVDNWFKPYFELDQWKYYDMSVKSRDETNDGVLRDAVEEGKRVGAIFKEPTITPTAEQREEMGLKNVLGSPNGAMRKGWNGVTISRDTIHIEGVDLGYKMPVLFERHAVGGEYGAGWKKVGKGKVLTTFHPVSQNDEPILVDSRDLENDNNVVVVYHNPLDNVEDLANHFFSRCLKAKVVPYVVTKKTVFKWQEEFWSIHKSVFDENYKSSFLSAGLLPDGELKHVISDAATMQIIKWTEGNFGMSAHNYDGDMLTDEVAQVHRSPGFITSNLIGRSDDGTVIKEFEASHGTVTDLWEMHLRGEETSLNPLGLVEAMIGGVLHSVELRREQIGEGYDEEMDKVVNFASTLRRAMHNTFRYGQGTRDMSGPHGYTTEDFVRKVAWRLERYLKESDVDSPPVLKEPSRAYTETTDAKVDVKKIGEMFERYDRDGNGTIDREEFTDMLVKLGVAPMVDKRG